MSYVYVVVNERDKEITGPFDSRIEAERCIPPSSKNLRVKTIALTEYARKKGQEKEFQIIREFSKNNKNN